MQYLALDVTLAERLTALPAEAPAANMSMIIPPQITPVLPFLRVRVPGRRVINVTATKSRNVAPVVAIMNYKKGECLCFVLNAGNSCLRA